MEWKWIKSLLIIFFLILNLFLGYQVYQRNNIYLVNSETLESVNSILSSRKISCSFSLSEVEVKKYMRRLNISNEENIKAEFIKNSDIDASYTDYTGRNREIIPLQSIVASFIRETKIENVVIENISLGYYPEINQIDKNILSGEAIPAWLIKLDSGEEYIYNAYVGDKIN